MIDIQNALPVMVIYGALETLQSQIIGRVFKALVIRRTHLVIRL